MERKIWNIKKIPGLSQGTTREKVTFINLYRNNYKLTNMCTVLNISSKTYYKYRNKEDPDYYDYLIIKEIFNFIISVSTFQRFSCFSDLWQYDLYYRKCINYNFSKKYRENACYMLNNHYLC